jgi:hypothetical protein
LLDDGSVHLGGHGLFFLVFEDESLFQGSIRQAAAAAPRPRTASIILTSTAWASP